MNPKGSPLFIFWHYATFSKFFQKKISKKKFSKNFSNFFFASSRVGKSDFPVISSMKGTLWVSLESVFKAFHEYILGIFRKLWAFWALDIAPTLDVPVLLSLAQLQTFFARIWQESKISDIFSQVLHFCQNLSASRRINISVQTRRYIFQTKFLGWYCPFNGYRFFSKQIDFSWTNFVWPRKFVWPRFSWSFTANKCW